MKPDRESVAKIILRVGLAFALIYASIGGILEPTAWVEYFPTFALGFVPDETLLLIWGLFQVILAVWILSGRKIFIPSALASFSLAGLIIFNLDATDVIFRDVTVLSVSIALMIENYPKTKQ